MVARRRAGKRGKGPARTGARLEWIGGRLSPPFFVDDSEGPIRAEMVIWMEMPSGLVVGQEAIDARESAGAVVRVLQAALERPAVGPARRPAAIRVADASLAAEVRSAVGDAIPVRIAPTPELDELLEFMLETLPDEPRDKSYLEEGRISRETVAELFRAAEILHHAAPWRAASDTQVLRLDIPALGVDGACISIIGELGQSRGFLIFPSLAGYETFVEAAEEIEPSRRRIDFGTGWLAFSLEHWKDLPESMAREAAEHDWPVAADDAYPVVERRDFDAAPKPLVERDLEIAAACATSLCAFFAKHGSLFEADELEPVCESYFDERDLEVRFTFPYAAFPLFDVDEGPASWPAPPAGPRWAPVGRNDPCPCGSGRKYKKCHMRSDERERAGRSEGDEHHDLDGRMVAELSRFADRRFGRAWWRFEKDFVDTVETLQLAVPWSVYGYPVRGATVLEWYLEEEGRGLARAERAWLDAQKAAWLSVWEVTDVERGTGLTLRDLLSGETRRVREVSGSENIVARDAVLARVVDHEDVSLLCGVHPQPLPPFDAAEVVRRARGRLRRKRAVPVERLRDGAFGRYLIRRWEEAVARLYERSATPLDLRNNDGDPILLTIDHFEIVPGARPEVEARLSALDDVEPRGDGEDPCVYAFIRPGDARDPDSETTLIGRVCISKKTLRLETNSRQRADALRKRVEAACGTKIRHRAREHTDPQSSRAPRPPGEQAPEAPPPELEKAMREYKERHYAEWLDHPLPALGGKTPREAVRTKSGRTAVDLLLKDMENHEQRLPAGPRYDFGKVRRALRLE